MDEDGEVIDSGHVQTERAGRAKWQALFNFTSKYHILPLILALISSITSGIVIPALAVFLGKAFNEFSNFGSGKTDGQDLVHKVGNYAKVLCILGGGSGLLNGAFYSLWLIFGELQAKKARNMLFDALLQKDLQWYDMRKSGIEPLISRLQAQIRDLQTATSQPFGFIVQYTATTVASLGIALFYSWSLTLVTLATLPISALFFTWISANMQQSVDFQAAALTEATKSAVNAISAIETVKCFNGQDHEIWQYMKVVRTAAKYYLIQARANALQIGFIRLVTLGMFVQGFWYGAHLVNTGKTSGDIVTAFLSALMAAQALEQILPQLIVLEKGRVAGATLLALRVQIERGRKVLSMAGGKSPTYCDGDIEVKNVKFSYPSRLDQLALDNVSMFFAAGETTFVVGKSGSGKSTISNLLLRFYAPASGNILIDSNAVQTLNLNWLRNNITLVQQQSVLFNETIFKNVAFGRHNHSSVKEEEIQQSIEMALLQNVIINMPQGLNTMLDSGGNSMSGGQKQRLAVARAHLRDTPILILDEATSALDHETKVLLNEAIRDWRKGKTTIIITHDMSQVLDDDYAYVLEDGRIVQEGFKHNLEKSSSGPFGVSGAYLAGIVPSDSREIDSADELKLTRDARNESFLSLSSVDSLDIEIASKSRFVPNAYSPPQGQHSRSHSKVIMSPVFATFSTQSRSMAPSTFHRPRRKSVEPVSTADLIELAHLVQAPAAETDTAQSPKRMTRIGRKVTQSSQKRRFSNTSTTVETNSQSSNLPAPVTRILMTVWTNLTWFQRLILILGFLAAGVHAAATPVFSWVFAKLLATFFLQEKEERSKQALKWSLTVLGVAVVDSTAGYLMHFLLEYCGQAWVDALRVLGLQRVLDQPRAWFDLEKNSLTRLLECLDRNAEEMRNLLGRFAGYVFVAVVMVTIAITWSLTLSWKLTLVGLSCAPFMYAVTRSFEHVSGKWESNSNDAGTAANTIFNETFSNIRTVRALTLESYFHAKYLKATNHAFTTGLKRAGYSGFFFGVSDSGILFVTALICWYGARLASADIKVTLNIITTLSMLLFSISNANAIIAFVPQINASRTTATQLLRLAHLPYRSSHEHTGHARLPHPGTIVFDSVSFTYPSRPTFPVFSSITLSIQPGRTIALVGASGSGKSTVAALLLGLQPPSSGTITINNIPLRSVHLPTLREHLAIVPQQPTLFPGTVAANITYALPEGSPLASHDKIRAAAKATGIDEFIMSLPEGYHTLIGPGGSGLSGGQQQRIAIARAIVRKPKLLILDEATSGLDQETAGIIRDLVMRLGREGVGVLAITHEKEMMRCCQEVAVMKDGGVAERGAFKLLARKQGGELRRLLGGGLE